MNEGQQQQQPQQQDPANLQIPIVLSVSQVNEILAMLSERALKDVIVLFNAIKSQADHAVAMAIKKAETIKQYEQQKLAENGHDSQQPPSDSPAGESTGSASRRRRAPARPSN